MRVYKRLTSCELFRRCGRSGLFKALPPLRKELWGGAFWASRSFAATMGQLGGYESVSRYVEGQGHGPEGWNLWLPFAPPDES